MKRTPSRSESLTGFVVLLLLSGIAVGIFLKQFHYDASLYTAPAGEGNPGAAASSGHSGGNPVDLPFSSPEGVTPLTPVETFGPGTLSDKINGKAELYLSAGFLNLQSRRFALEGAPEAWVEIFVYDMGSPRNAFAVFSSQRRTDGTDLEGVSLAYATPNALFLVQDRYYVEMVASAPHEALARVMETWTRDLLQKSSTDSGGLTEEKAFPPENLQAGSLTLLSSDVFGFEGLNNVFIAQYAVEGRFLSAFLSLRKTPEEAQRLAVDYHDFLLRSGGSDAAFPCEVPDCRVVQVFDTVEVFFSHGAFLAGVHEAEDAALGIEMAQRLYRRLIEVAP